jgi:hypothetical protein
VQKEVAPGDAPVLAGKKLASLVGRDVSDQQAAKIGSVVYWALGMSYGMAAAVLARAGVPPLVAGIATGAMALVVDGGVMSAFFTPRLWPTRSIATCGSSWGISVTGPSPGRCSPLYAGWAREDAREGEFTPPVRKARDLIRPRTSKNLASM